MTSRFIPFIPTRSARLFAGEREYHIGSGVGPPKTYGYRKTPIVRAEARTHILLFGFFYTTGATANS